MMNDMVYIYESPDGGKTIFRRKFGETNREMKVEVSWVDFVGNSLDKMMSGPTTMWIPESEYMKQSTGGANG